MDYDKKKVEEAFALLKGLYPIMNDYTKEKIAGIIPELSIPEEQPSEDLENGLNNELHDTMNYLKSKRKIPTLKGEQLHEFKNEVNTIKQIINLELGKVETELLELFALAIATWGAEHLRDSTKKIEPSEDLEKELRTYLFSKEYLESKESGCLLIAHHFAQWQKEQMQKGSRIGVVTHDNFIELSGDKSIDLDPSMQNTPAFKFEPHTKVRVIIVKEK